MKKTQRKKPTNPLVRNQWQREAVTIDCSRGEKLTQDHHEQTQSIHHILDRFRRTGILPTSENPEYGEADDSTFFEKNVALANIQSSFSNLTQEEQKEHGDAFQWLNNIALQEQKRQQEMQGEIEGLGPSLSTPEAVPSSPPADQSERSETSGEAASKSEAT